MNAQLGQRICIDPNVMTGKPVIRGTRVPVELIVRMLAQGISEDDILHQYPRLQLEDTRAALAYAARMLAHEDVATGSHAPRGNPPVQGSMCVWGGKEVTGCTPEGQPESGGSAGWPHLGPGPGSRYQT